MVKAVRPNVRVAAEIGGDIDFFLGSFTRHLRAERRAPATMKSYQGSIRNFAQFLTDRGMPVVVADITREHVQEYVIWLHELYQPATVQSRFNALRVFFGWLDGEGELVKHPMLRLKQPALLVDPPDVLTGDELAHLLKATTGKTLYHRRDEAIIRLMHETGLRRAEVAGLKLTDVDLDLGTAAVIGKGSRPRVVPFGAKTARAIDRYLRVRRDHAHAASAWLWLGKRGPLSAAGVATAIKQRAIQAGIDEFHVHRLRHTAADKWLTAGGQEGDLMRIMGWRSRAMLARYGAARADARAHEAARRLNLGDDL